MLYPPCPICLSTPADIAIPQCFHLFCKSCLTQYTEIKISEGQVLTMRCPFSPCAISLDSIFIQSYLPEVSFNKYLISYQKKSLEADVKFRWCPQKSCEGFDVQKSSNELTCNQCGYEFCLLCAAAWHGTTKCKSSDDPGFIRWVGSNNVKYCPNCRVRTEKNGGCPRMVCAKCGEIWCWRCGLKISQHGDMNCLFRNNGFDITWYGIVLMISAPITFPFWAGFWVLGLIIYNDILMDETDKLMRMIMKNCWIWLIIAFIVSPVLIALGLVLGSCGVSLALTLTLTPNMWSPAVTWYIFAVIYIILMVSVFLTVIIALAAIGFALIPVIGIILVPLRVYYQLRAR